MTSPTARPLIDPSAWPGLLRQLPQLTVLIAGGDGKILYASREIQGHAPEALACQPIEVLGPNLGGALRAHIDAQMGQKGGEGLEESLDVTVTAPDGTERLIEVRLIRTTGAASEGPLFLVTLRDVTADRKLEEQLRQAQKMEAVGRLAGGVAHDFNNLLTAIITFAGFVRDETLEGDPRRSDIGEVLRAADRASRLTRQLLTFSRRQKPELAVVDLNDVVVNVDRMLRRTLGADIELVTLLASDPLPVLIDTGQFEQVLMNLAINARDAMPHGGKLTIALSLEEEEGVVLRVTDTGTGMGEDVLAHAFEPFFTTKEAGKGTGLGLATCYGIVRQAGGDIRLESERERGTTVTITLPRRQQEMEQQDRSPETAVTNLGGDETILVVEDEPAVLDSTIRILERHGYAVLRASNGLEAVQLVRDREARPDLLLSDMVMPHMSGRELARRLRALFPRLHVLMMTGYAVEGRGEEVRDGTARWPLLYKPFTDRQLLEKVRRVLGERRGKALPRVLLVEPSLAIRQEAVRRLGERVELRVAGDAGYALELLRKEPEVDVVVCALTLGKSTGVELFARAIGEHPRLTHRFLFVVSEEEAEARDEAASLSGRPPIERPITWERLEEVIEVVRSDA